MPSKIKSLSFIVPCLNEEENISEFIKRIQPFQKQNPSLKYEIIFVDDGSQDKTLTTLRELSRTNSHVRYVSLTRNFGSHLAMLAGLDSAATDAVIFIPCDHQGEPELINQMIKIAKEGAEIVIGERINKKPQIINRFLSWGFYFLFNQVGDVRLPAGGSDFFLITERPIEFLRKNKEYNVNIFMLLLWPGFKCKTLECGLPPRKSGKTKWTFKKRFRLAMDSFFGFSVLPLRLITLAGIIFSTSSFLFFSYTIVNYFYLGTPVPGIPTVVCTITFGFGCIFLALGIIAEYLFRVLDFSRNRSLFVISEQSEPVNEVISNIQSRK
jgi:polyisoprenyl-phosphate glycosyltransferase